MRVKHSTESIQLFFLLFFIFVSPLFPGCNRSAPELPVVPPATNPLTREFIGFGVVNLSFTHMLSEPGSSGVSQGYLRRGTVVRVIERRQVNQRGVSGLWVLVEGNYQEPGGISRGWLEEATLEIYDMESRAITASRNMGQ